MSDYDAFKERVANLVRDRQWNQLRELFKKSYPADLAKIITRAHSDQRNLLFDCVPEELKPDTLSELEGRAGADVLESLTNPQLSELVEDMSPDDAADLLEELGEKRSAQVLNLMEQEESDEVRNLLQYGSETAGGLMTPDLISFRSTQTISQLLDDIASSDQEEPFYYAYVTDDAGHLLGYIALWELLKIKVKDTLVGDLAHHETIFATTDMDQEEVAQLISRYDLTAIPVVDQAHKLVGRVTVDDVMDVMEDEASEDIFRLAGSNDSELEHTTALQACVARLPWLLITLCTGFISSLLLKRFMTDLPQVLVLTFFVPIVMAMGGNTGIQSSTLLVRGLALGVLDDRSVFRHLGREMLIGAMMGLFCGLVIGVWAHFLIGISPDHGGQFTPIFLAATVSLSLFSAMTFAAIYGAFVPIVLDRFNIDPAVASGPFVTASNDISAMLIYYGISLALIRLYSSGILS